MYIKFNKNEPHVQLIVGALEEYVPSEKMKYIVEKVQQMKKTRDLYIENLNIQADEIQKLVDEENTKIQEQIKEKNNETKGKVSDLT